MAQPLSAFKSGPLNGRTPVRGDKSISHRALMLGAISEGTTEITGLLEADDISATARALQSLGADISVRDGRWIVTGRGLGGFVEPGAALDFGNSGTGARLMMGIVTGHAFTAEFTGDDSLCRRPMGRVLDPLMKMGLHVRETGRETLPLTLTGTASPVPVVYRLPVASAQVKSAVLLAGLYSSGETTVIETEQTRDHTEKMLGAFGAAIETRKVQGPEGRERHIVLTGQPKLKGQMVQVPGDPSSAAFLVAAALICPGSDITVENVLVNPTRTGFYDTIQEMGADLSFEDERLLNGEPCANIRVRYSPLQGVQVPAERAPTMIDEYPVLSALAAFAEGDTVMEGLAELRVKESDRLEAMVRGLRACGVMASSRGDTLTVSGGRAIPGGARIHTDMDHRIAMAFLTLGLGSVSPVTVDDTTMINTSFPGFRDIMERLGAAYGEPETLMSSGDDGTAAQDR
jgi:3-phosphoshikimate 1-carboxyvinyltransferase